MDSKYSDACKEVLVLFEYFLDEDDLSKIPRKQIEHLRKNANKEYDYFVDESKELEGQEISKEAKAIIINLYKKYFATNEQKKKINEIISLLDSKKNTVKTNKVGFNSLEEALRYKNDIKENENAEIMKPEEKALVKSKSIWKKFFDKILKFFKI